MCRTAYSCLLGVYVVGSMGISSIEIIGIMFASSLLTKRKLESGE